MSVLLHCSDSTLELKSEGESVSTL